MLKLNLFNSAVCLALCKLVSVSATDSTLAINLSVAKCVCDILYVFFLVILLYLLTVLYLLLVAVLLFQLSTRFRNNVDDKMRKLGYIGVGVSPVGQRLVDTITKTCVTLSAIFLRVFCFTLAQASLLIASSLALQQVLNSFYESAACNHRRPNIPCGRFQTLEQPVQ